MRQGSVALQQPKDLRVCRIELFHIQQLKIVSGKRRTIKVEDFCSPGKKRNKTFPPRIISAFSPIRWWQNTMIRILAENNDRMRKAIEIAPPDSMEQRFNHLWHLVGNTPMLEITYSYQGRQGHIFVKCEHYNLTGSVKDRMALFVLYRAYCAGLLKPGDIIAEATSGNT